MTADNPNERLPAGTRVLNTNDGEPGAIMNGVTFDPAVGWTEYEVETEHGIEVWPRADFAVFLDLEDAMDEADRASANES